MSAFDLVSQSTKRAPVNPLDKSTIFSICPMEVNDRKPTIFPGYFHIDKGSVENPSRLVVGPSSWWKYVDENQPMLEIPTSSIVMAESVINDFCNGLLGCNMSDSMPGFMYIPGDITVEKLKKEYTKEFDNLIAKQRNWFLSLVKKGDIDWSRTGGNPLAISDDMRMAAKQLGLESKDWMQNFQAMEMVRCIACGNMRNPLFPMCANCHTVVDMDLAKKLKLDISASK